jgi:exonuclease SbcD
MKKGIKPVAVVMTDTHIGSNNTDLIKSVFIQTIEHCQRLEISTILHCGDWFQSRAGQPLEVLKVTQEIIENLRLCGITFHIIPGNHDKKDLESEDSYLDIFNSETFRVVKTVGFIEFRPEQSLGYLAIHFIPYFKENGKYPELLTKAAQNCNPHVPNILCTHIAVNGVRNNDGSQQENEITTELFDRFDKVFVGHFHNRSKLGNNIYYIGSTHATNFGEDNDKGIVILNSDGSFEYQALDTPQFKRYEINIDDLSASELNALSNEKDNSGGDHIRVIVTGSKERLKTFDKALLSDIGIDCQLKSEEAVRATEEAEKNEFEVYDNNSIAKEFKAFCKEKKHDVKQGEKYLNQVLK